MEVSRGVLSLSSEAAAFLSGFVALLLALSNSQLLEYDRVRAHPRMLSNAKVDRTCQKQWTSHIFCTKVCEDRFLSLNCLCLSERPSHPETNARAIDRWGKHDREALESIPERALPKVIMALGNECIEPGIATLRRSTRSPPYSGVDFVFKLGCEGDTPPQA